MAIDFPPSPTVNDIFIAEDRTWIYRGSGVWDSVQNPSNIGQTVTATTGTFNIDCQAATDFYLDFDDSYFTTPDYKTITVVNTSSADFGAATTGTLTLPASMQEGDLVIVAVGSDLDSATAISVAAPSTGWTTAASGVNNRLHIRAIFYKVMGASPDASINLANFSTASTAVAIAIRNGEFELISSATTGANAGSGTPNAPSVTTTLNNSMVVAVGFLDDDSIATASITAPTGYSNLVSQEAVALTGFTTMLATKIVATAGAEDPAAFTVTGGTDDNSAYSIVIKPIIDTIPTATINFTNIPTIIKELTVFGTLPNIAHPSGYINLSWDTDIVQITGGLPTLLSETTSFQKLFFTYDSKIFSYKGQIIEHTDIITGTSTWTAPADVRQVDVLLCGGGGGGDTVGTGGAGSVNQKILSVTPGTTYTITIGAGGVGAASPTAGSTSSFGSLFSVAGGGAGTSSNLSDGPGGVGGFGYETAFTGIAKITGIDAYGNGGSSRSDALAGEANTGNGGDEGFNGGSGVCIIKYWSAY